ncbi:hypothetical protein JN11_01739 [Mucilaginibacter frigoritolerans]|uniref:Histone H1 n=1 Tax=Mucilaginibacter frigoritolerans TaxID=652788 RepID=A0A562U731_9SPHI|nr:histone H1 [Mucilaginibacter frigoritolerans]TWJ01588.1 hypothetical protein JN11_01739 [Mucilaginibacter frigoritolerans]
MTKKDLNQLAKFIIDISMEETEDTNKDKKLSNEEVKGRTGGLVGGNARANSLTAEQRSEIAKKAAEKRWGC